MPNLKNINQKRQSPTPKTRHSRSKKYNKLSGSIEDVDDQHNMLKILKIDLENAIQESDNNKVNKLLTKAKADKVLTRLFSCDATTGENILHTALLYGNCQILTILLDVAKDINDNHTTLRDLLLANNQSGKNALHISISSIPLNSLGATLTILSYAKSVNDENKTLKTLIESYDKSNTTALDMAALHGNVIVLTELLDAAKVVGEHTLESLLLHQDINKYNALHTASLNGYIEVATKLLDVAESIGINTARKLILATNNLNENVLHISAESKKNHNDALMTKLLNIASNLSVNKYNHEHNVLQKLLITPNKSGLYPLDIAAHNQNPKIIVALFDAVKNMQDSKDILKDLLFHTNNSSKNSLYTLMSNEEHRIFSSILDTVKNTNNITFFKKLLVFYARSHDSILHILLLKNKTTTLFEYLLHTIKDLADVKYKNDMNSLGGYIDIIEEINTDDPKMIKHIACNDSIKLNQIITCFKKNKFNLTNTTIPNDYLYRAQYINADKCISRIGCYNAAAPINDDQCTKAIEYIEDKNNLLIRVILYPDRSRYNILHLAASKGYYEVIRKLLDEAKYIDTWKYDSTKQYTDSNKCIDIVIKDRGRILVENLLKKIKSDNTTFERYLFSTTLSEKDNVLHIAAQKKDIKTVRKLLQYLKNLGDDNHTLKKLLESTNKSGNTALGIAIQEKDIKVICKLLKYLKNLGDDNHTLKKLLESTNESGDTALGIAIQEKDIKVICKLLKYLKNLGG